MSVLSSRHHTGSRQKVECAVHSVEHCGPRFVASVGGTTVRLLNSPSQQSQLLWRRRRSYRIKQPRGHEMSLILIVVLLLLLFGGGGFYGYRSGYYGGRGFGGILGLLVVVLLLYLILGGG